MNYTRPADSVGKTHETQLRALTFVVLFVLKILAVQHVEQPQHWGGEHHQVFQVRGCGAHADS